MPQARTESGRMIAGAAVGALLIASAVLLAVGTKWFLARLQATVAGGMTVVEFLNVDPTLPPRAGSSVRVRVTNRDNYVAVYDWLALLNGDATGEGTVTVEGGLSVDFGIITRSAGILVVEVRERTDTRRELRWRSRLTTQVLATG